MKGTPSASARTLAALANSAKYWTRFSFTEESKRVVSMFTTICPASTTCPSWTRISETTPPSRLCITCNCLEGITLPSPLVISSTSDKPAHNSASTNTTPRLLTSIRARSGSCSSIARSASPPNPASMERSSCCHDAKNDPKGRVHEVHLGFMRLFLCVRPSKPQ